MVSTDDIVLLPFNQKIMLHSNFRSQLAFFLFFTLTFNLVCQAQKKDDFVTELSQSYAVENHLTDQIVTSYIGRTNRISKSQQRTIIAVFDQYRRLKVQNEDLSPSQRAALGVNQQVFDLFRWNLFIENHYVNYPSLFEHTAIWGGMIPAVYLGLFNKMSKQTIENEAFVFRHQQTVYDQLKARLAARSDTDYVAKQGYQFLAKGDFTGLEQVLVTEAEQASFGKGYKNYEAAMAEELNCHSLEASFHYRLAIAENNHAKFNLNYAKLLFQHNNLEGAKRQLLESDETTVQALIQQQETLLGHISLSEGDFDLALKHYSKAQRLAPRGDYQTLEDLTVLQTVMGNYNQALKNHKKLWSLEQRKYGSSHTIIASRYNKIGNIYLASGDEKQADYYFKAALKLNTSYFGKNNPRLSDDYKLLAQVEVERKNYEAGLYYLNLALSNEEKHNHGEFTHIISLQNKVGVLYLENQLPQKAVTEFEKSLAMLSQSNNKPLLASVYYNLGLSYLALRDDTLASLNFTKALQLDKQVYSTKHPELIIGYKSLDVYATSKEEYQMVSFHYMRIMNIAPELWWEFLPETGTGYVVLANASSVRNNQNRTLAYFLKALQVDEGVLGEGHHDLGVDHNILGVLYLEQGNKIKALYHLQLAKRIYSYHLPGNHPYVINVNKRINGLQLMAVE